EPAFLDHLFHMGRRSAEDWLASTFDRIGVESTIDIEETYL
ncbi:MAG: patatin-like phospholipase family protein, partial [Alphaproteobacteria bacterium]|nr:patatin-like phospholipase family protein [Alphaproteobacteria bacterium]